MELLFEAHCDTIFIKNGVKIDKLDSDVGILIIEFI